MATRMLDQETLNAFRASLHDHGSGFAAILREGRARSSQVDAAPDFAFAFPEELARWWEWQDGTTQPGALFDDFCLFSLADANDWFRFVRGEAEATVEMLKRPAQLPDADRLWPRWLFPVLTGSSGTIAVDCRGDLTAPVHYVNTEHGPTGQPAAESLRQMVTWWIGAVDAGAWRVNHHGVFVSHQDDMTPEWRASGLV